MSSKHYSVLSLSLLLVSSLLGSDAIAKPLAKHAGFSGTMGINADVNDTQSQFNIVDDNEQTQGLNNPGKEVTTAVLCPFFAWLIQPMI